MIMIFAAYLMTGVIVFHFLCGWDILDSVYFICVTFSTIGYGDFDADQTITELLLYIIFPYNWSNRNSKFFICILANDARSY